MKQSLFVAENEALWQQLEAWLAHRQLPKREQRKQPLPQPLEDFPAAYRRLCHHLALAQSRMYSPLLIERLNRLVVEGHQHLYSARMHFWHRVVTFYLRELPRLVRTEWHALALSALLFFGSLAGMIIAIQLNPELVYAVLPGEQVAAMEQMYDPDNRSRIGREREADSDVLMFGFYIRNNTGIGFQVFAGGLLYGLGSLFFLLYNGLVIGAVAGHLTHIGYIETFWSFVAGHSAFELTAIMLSGVAGFKLAQALIMPGRKSRRQALLDNSRIAIRIIYGAATLFIMAAFVEAFWSSQTVISPLIKYATGSGLWLLVIAYFRLAGREQA
ncbi:MAG: stage II sporulation protein M [Thiothrix sp.]|nr:stage II sporulation protein M [Thiothrix sp.]HPE59781.1 stage II sporulation protein M [Thiolinea sp.]